MTESHRESLSSSLRDKVRTSGVATVARYVPIAAKQVCHHVGKEFVASNGVIQGCLLNVLLPNLLMNTWARSVKTETTTAMPKVYADDAGVLSKNS